MDAEFELEIVTPLKTIFSGKVSQVVLNAFDGERGILSNHENFIGQLGVGSVKVIKGGDDYWYVLSGGVYEFNEGKLKLLCLLGEPSSEIKIENVKQRILEVQQKIKQERDSKNIDVIILKELDNELKLLEAKVNVYNRQNVSN